MYIRTCNIHTHTNRERDRENLSGNLCVLRAVIQRMSNVDPVLDYSKSTVHRQTDRIYTLAINGVIDLIHVAGALPLHSQRARTCRNHNCIISNSFI